MLCSDSLKAMAARSQLLRRGFSQKYQPTDVASKQRHERPKSQSCGYCATSSSEIGSEFKRSLFCFPLRSTRGMQIRPGLDNNNGIFKYISVNHKLTKQHIYHTHPIFILKYSRTPKIPKGPKNTDLLFTTSLLGI